MGIFGFKTKYDINPKVENLKTLVTNYNDIDVIKMNAKLVVPEGYFFVLGKRGQALDRFDSGEYFLNTSVLPYACRRFNIDKVKGGKTQDKIPADFYFLNKNLWGGMFKTYRKANLGTKTYGMFSVKVKGVFSYKIIEPREFMQSLLNEFDYIRTGEAEDIVNSWVGDEILAELESKNFMINDIIANADIVVDSLTARVAKLFSIAGLELMDLKIVKYELPKEYQEASDKILKMQEMGQQQKSNPNEANENVLEQEHTTQPKSEEISKIESEDLDAIMNNWRAAQDLLNEFNIGGNSQQDTKNLEQNEPYQEEVNALNKVLSEEELAAINNELAKDEQEFKSFIQEQPIINDKKFEETLAENFSPQENPAQDDLFPTQQSQQNIIEENNKTQKTEISELNLEPKNNTYVPFGDFVIEDSKNKQEQPAQESTQTQQKPKRNFIDLSLSDIYTSNQTKRCINCGSENSINATRCVICGDIFISD